MSAVSPSRSHNEITRDASPDNDTPMQVVDQSDEMLNLPSTSTHQQHSSGILSTRTYRSAQETAALFLLRFKEQYKLPQSAINFAVGSINSIVESVCDDVYESVQASLQRDGCTAELAACFQEHQDPFASLHTEYRQSKFYRDVFGLVVNSLHEMNVVM